MSGGVKGAVAGTLAFMVGGTESAFAAARSTLDPMAGKIIHCGSAGAGQAAKVCNNMVLACSRSPSARRSCWLRNRLVRSGAVRCDHRCHRQLLGRADQLPVPGPVPTSPANNDYKPGLPPL